MKRKPRLLWIGDNDFSLSCSGPEKWWFAFMRGGEGGALGIADAKAAHGWLAEYIDYAESRAAEMPKKMRAKK